MVKKTIDGDIAVVGLGSMGSFAYWQLAKQGVDVIGFERHQPGHEHGSGHGESRIFRTAYGEGVEYVPLLQTARNLWRELEEETRTQLYVENGGTMFGLKDDPFMQTVDQSVRQFKLPHKAWDSVEANQIYPQINFQKEQTAIFEKYAGFIKPELAIQTAVKRGDELGGKALIETEVTHIDFEDKSVIISTARKTYRVNHVILAAGGWTTSLVPQVNLPVTYERQVLVWFKAKDPGKFKPKNFPIFSRMKDGIGFYGFPSLDGKTVKVALHHGGQIINHPDEIDRQIHESDLAPIIELVKEYFPDLIPEPVNAVTCFYTNTPDEHFVLGSLSNLPEMTLLGPMGGHGFKFAPIMGKIASQLAKGHAPELPISMFDPNRFK